MKGRGASERTRGHSARVVWRGRGQHRTRPGLPATRLALSKLKPRLPRLGFKVFIQKYLFQYAYVNYTYYILILVFIARLFKFRSKSTLTNTFP